MADSTYSLDVTGRLLKVRDVATALNVSEHTIRVWLMNGTIRFIKLGRATRISEDELHRLVAAGFKSSREQEPWMTSAAQKNSR